MYVVCRKVHEKPGTKACCKMLDWAKWLDSGVLKGIADTKSGKSSFFHHISKMKTLPCRYGIHAESDILKIYENMNKERKILGKGNTKVKGWNNFPGINHICRYAK